MWRRMGVSRMELSNTVGYVARLASGVIDRSRVRAWSSRTARACRWRRTRRARRRRRTARRAPPPSWTARAGAWRRSPAAPPRSLSAVSPASRAPSPTRRRRSSLSSYAHEWLSSWRKPAASGSTIRGKKTSQNARLMGTQDTTTSSSTKATPTAPPWGGGGTDPKRREMKARRGDGRARGSPFLFPICTPLSTVVQDDYYF